MFYLEVSREGRVGAGGISVFSARGFNRGGKGGARVFFFSATPDTEKSAERYWSISLAHRWLDHVSMPCCLISRFLFVPVGLFRSALCVVERQTSRMLEVSFCRYCLLLALFVCRLGLNVPSLVLIFIAVRDIFPLFSCSGRERWRAWNGRWCGERREPLS